MRYTYQITHTGHLTHTLNSRMSHFQLNPPNTKCPPQDPSTVTSDTASTDPQLMKSRVFVGCLKKEVCQRENVIELFSMYGPLIGVSYFSSGGFAYVQYESIQDANSAVRHLNKFNFQGNQLNVKIANPNMQKPLKQGGPNQGQQQPRQKQFNNGNQFQNKPYQQQRFNQQSTPFNAFGTARSYNSNKPRTQSRGDVPPSKFGTAANAIPLGGAGYKNRQQMPQHPTKRARYNDPYQQKGNSETQDYGSTNYNEQDYGGYQNTYSQIEYETGTGGEEPSTAKTSQQPSQYQSAQYEEGEYAEGEYPEYSYGQAASYDQNYQYADGTYYDEFGQPVEYAAQEGYEGEEFDYSKYQYVDGVYYDEFGQPVAYYPEEGYEGQEYDPTEYADYYNEAGISERPPDLEPPSKPRKAEFINSKMKEPAPKPKKQPAAVQELSERPIHYNYEVPDMFICGGCHFCTANPQYFIQHRAKPCKIKQVARGEDEPPVLNCHMCAEEVRNSWDLVRHLGTKHCLYLFNETYAAGTD